MLGFPLGILSAAGAEVGVAGSYELIATSVLTTNTTSVTFSNLADFSSDYKHLQLRLAARGNRASFAQDVLRVYLNGDLTSLGYNSHDLTSNGSSVTSGFTSNGNFFASVTGSGSTANAFGAGVADFLDAYSTTKFTTIRSLSGHVTPDAGGATGKRVSLRSTLYRDTSSLTSIRIETLDSTLITGSRFSLYGIR